MCRITYCFLPSFQPTDKVLANSLVVFVFDSYAAAAVLTTRVHEIWARFFSGTALSLSRYNASDCFETFPFPSGYESRAALEKAGKEYYEFRADLMVRNNEGLTKTYNRFHDPNEDSPRSLACASCTPPWIAPFLMPTAGRIFSRSASSSPSSTTKRMGTTTAGRRRKSTATSGQRRSTTRSLPAYSN